MTHDAVTFDFFAPYCSLTHSHS